MSLLNGLLERADALGDPRTFAAWCVSDTLPDDDDDGLADLVADEWADWLKQGLAWIFDVLDSLTSSDEPAIDVRAAADPELDTYGMSAGALLQVAFNPVPQTDETLLRAIKALREMVESYGDGVCKACAIDKVEKLARGDA